MESWVVKAAIVFDQAGLGLHVEVESDGLLGELIKRLIILKTILAIEDDVDGSFTVLLFVHKFEDLFGFLNIAEHELSRHSPRQEKIV